VNRLGPWIAGMWLACLLAPTGPAQAPEVGAVPVEELIRRLDSPETRDQAADELRERGADVLPQLLEALEAGGSEERRASLVGILGRIGDPRARPALERCLTDPSALIRREAALALGRLGAAEAVPALVSALTDPDTEVRGYAAFALGELGDRRALVPLLRLLGEDAEQVRDYAAVALGRLRDLRALPALLWLLAHDPSPYVRAHAALSLGELGSKGACGGLVAALEDPSDLVRRRAYRSLSTLSGQRFPFHSHSGALLRKEQVARWRSWYESVRGTLGEVEPVAPRQLARRLTGGAVAGGSRTSLSPPSPQVLETAPAPRTTHPAPKQEPTIPPEALRAFDAGTQALGRGDWSAARDALSRAVSLAPQWADAHYNLAVAHLKLGHTEQAVEELRLATTLAPEDGEAWGFLGALLWAEGDLSEAQKALSRSAAMPGASVGTLFNLASVALEVRDYGTSARWFAALEERGFEALPTPLRGEAHLRAGIAFYHNGEVTRALKHLEEARKAGVRAPLLRVYLGHACRALGRLSEAAEHYRSARAAGLRDPDLLSHLAEVLIAEGDYAGAEPVLRDLLGSQPSDAQGWLGLGLCLWRQGKSDEALRALRKAHKLRPEDESAPRALARLLLRRGEAAQAAALLAPLVQSHPDDAEAHYELGLALRDAGRGREAEPHLRAAVELAPAEVRYRVALAGLLLSLGKAAEALSLAEEVVKRAPAEASHHALLAEAYSRLGRWGEALKAIERALSLEPDNRDYARRRLHYLEATRSQSPSGPRP